MTLIVEDGTGMADAESYATVADADAHFAARGYTLWATLSDSEKEQALRRATDWMVSAFRMRWAGYRINSTQALDWPRYDVPIPDTYGSIYGVSYYASNVVPPLVVKACCELAYTAAHGELLDDMSQQKKSVTVGPITTVYGDNTNNIKRYPRIDRMLAPLLVGGAGSLKVVRA